VALVLLLSLELQSVLPSYFEGFGEKLFHTLLSLRFTFLLGLLLAIRHLLLKDKFALFHLPDCLAAFSLDALIHQRIESFMQLV
jgi:hypothetical protein